eukprot:TRINITY_DN8440_c0_g1_i1.p1 TRINITY_DN8440_c0_g1~~TRINITY_DN8440_c0_g1_i1.p1  ORF type:complete len:135 (-),score=56.77 TRINITY_DN8440_c0_g1_i1:27-431(-)
MNLNSGNKFAFIAGLLAASASIFGKFALDSTTQTIFTSFLQQNYSIEIIFRIFCFLLLIVSNVLMTNFFAKSLDLTSTIQAVVINSAVNYCFSAILGHLFFSEPLSLNWWFGAFCIIMGVILINQNSNEINKQK